jgi:hypothetical protein
MKTTGNNRIQAWQEKRYNSGMGDTPEEYNKEHSNKEQEVAPEAGGNGEMEEK